MADRLGVSVGSPGGLCWGGVEGGLKPNHIWFEGGFKPNLIWFEGRLTPIGFRRDLNQTPIG